MSDEDTFVSPDKELSVVAKPKEEMYKAVCSHLERDDYSFFRRLGVFADGRVRSSQVPYGLRRKTLTQKLQCYFEIAEADFFSDGSHFKSVRVDCGQIDWIQKCIAGHVPDNEEDDP